MVESYRLFGRAMLEHLDGGLGKYSYERDDGFLDPADVRPYFAPYRKWPEGERRALRWARGRVLDVGCGAGRVALTLQRRGLPVIGIDVSSEAVRCARLRGVKDVRAMDARRLNFPPRTFDTIVMFGNNFGICGDFAATKRFLRRARAIARPGGRLLASTAIPASWMKQHAAYLKRNVARGLPPGLVRLRIRFRRQVGSWFRLLFLSPDDVLRLCAATGWDVESVILEPRGQSTYAFVAGRA